VRSTDKCGQHHVGACFWEHRGSHCAGSPIATKFLGSLCPKEVHLAFTLPLLPAAQFSMVDFPMGLGKQGNGGNNL
jgi:hypothetical protein